MCFEVLGTILGILIYAAYFVGFVGDSHEQRCEGGVREPDENQRRAYRYSAITMGVIIAVCITVTFLGVREQNGMFTTKCKISVKVYFTIYHSIE